jgi:glutaredoxin
MTERKHIPYRDGTALNARGTAIAGRNLEKRKKKRKRKKIKRKKRNRGQLKAPYVLSVLGNTSRGSNTSAL